MGAVGSGRSLEVQVMTRKRLILLVLAVLMVVAIKNAKSRRESEWRGLTESQARSKLDAKLPSRIPDDKRSMISDKVMAKMRDKGIIIEDVSDEPSSTAQATTDDTTDETVDVRDSTGEAADAPESADDAAEPSQN